MQQLDFQKHAEWKKPVSKITYYTSYVYDILKTTKLYDRSVFRYVKRGVHIKTQHKETFWSAHTVLYIDYDKGYRNFHVY